MTDGKINTGTSAALGTFDGLHLGHMSVLKNALCAEGLSPAVLLFDSSPKDVLSGSDTPKLMSDKKREEMLCGMGFKIYKISFREIMNFSPEEFFDEIIIGRLGAKKVCCGFNYTFGKGARGNSETLNALCEKNGIECSVSGEVIHGGEIVSSTRIREYISGGSIEKANGMLGRAFSFSGAVIHGDARGHTLGFPTANVPVDVTLAVPRFGAYESLVTLGDKKYKAVTNIGRRPTYPTENVLSETFITDFKQDIYGKEIEISLLRFIREEKLFDSAESLINQLKKDVDGVTENVLGL